MPSNFNRATAAVNAEAQAVTALLNSGWLCIMGGTQPANSDIEVPQALCLVEIPLPAQAFKLPINGKAVAYPINEAISEPSARKATWFRAFMPDHETQVFDGSVGLAKVLRESLGDADLLLDDVLVGGGMQVRIIQLIYQARK